MLRKNMRSPSSQPNLPNSVATQTEDFMLFLPLQQKLSGILEEYRALQAQYHQSQDMLEYYEFKNNILENSLHELTFSFENKLGESKIRLCDDILELEKMIERESREAECIERITVSRIDGDMTSKSNQSNGKSDKSKNKQVSSTRSKEAEGYIPRRKYSQKPKTSQVLSQRKIISHSLVKDLSASHNQFLQIPPKVLNTSEKHSSNVISSSYAVNSSAVCAKSQSNNTKVKKQDCKGANYQSNDKENRYVDVMIKRQAELNLRRFLMDFESANMHAAGKVTH